MCQYICILICGGLLNSEIHMTNKWQNTKKIEKIVSNSITAGKTGTQENKTITDKTTI